MRGLSSRTGALARFARYGVLPRAAPAPRSTGDHVEQPEVQQLLRDRRARDDYVLVAGELLRLGERRLDPFCDEVRVRPVVPPLLLGGDGVGHHDDRHTDGVLALPPVGDVEQLAPGDQRADAPRSPPGGTSASSSDWWKSRFSFADSVFTGPALYHSSLLDAAVRILDVAVQRHRHG